MAVATEGVQVIMRRSGEVGEYDFSDPRDARRFLREFHFPNGKGVELVRQRNGVVINVLMLDDFAVVEWAREIHDEYFARGIGYVETTDLH